jgi:hypothetical protein
MKLFEIHITGEKSILSEFELLGIKTIVIDLLYPDKTILRTEYMSSFILKKESIGECINYVVDLLSKIKTKIIRVKIESPFYDEYKDLSLYMESHFIPGDDVSYPVSQNQKSGKYMGTDREYNKSNYQDFIDKWIGNNNEIELCLYDSFKEEDFDWFEKYNPNESLLTKIEKLPVLHKPINEWVGTKYKPRTQKLIELDSVIEIIVNK